MGEMNSLQERAARRWRRTTQDWATLKQDPRAYWTAWYKQHKPNKKFGISNPIIVYQMGKVGSTSIYHALLNLDLDVPVYHSHRLSNLEAIERWTRQDKDGARSLEKLAEEFRLREIFFRHPNWRWFVVSGVREPVTHAISIFFFNHAEYFAAQNTAYVRGEISLEQAAARFFEKLPARGNDWFSYQLEPVFGVDVYAKPFPHARGYEIYESRRARALVLRFEDLKHQFKPALQELLGIEQVELPHTNLSESQGYGELYRDFVRQAKLPREWVDEMLSKKFAQHFYTQRELEASRARWVQQ